jgi:hypothetical protein
MPRYLTINCDVAQRLWGIAVERAEPHGAELVLVAWEMGEGSARTMVKRMNQSAAEAVGTVSGQVGEPVGRQSAHPLTGSPAHPLTHPRPD